MRGDIARDDPAVFVGRRDQDMQNLQSRRRHDEEVDEASIYPLISSTFDEPATHGAPWQRLLEFQR
jgi:hypothetical protein